MPHAVRLSVDTTNYDVSGTTVEAIATGLAEYGPLVGGLRRYAATDTEIRWEYGTRSDPVGCHVRQPRVSVTMHVILPRWTERYSATDSLAGAWSRFSEAIGQHEGEHQRLSVDAARGMLATLSGLRGSSCHALGSLVNDRMRRHLDDLHQAQLQFDERTNSGANAGVVWPRNETTRQR